MKRLVVMLLTIAFTVGSGAVLRAQKEKPLTKDQAINLLNTATTAGQHEQLAQYFNQKAAKLEAEANEHLEWANAYHKGKTPRMANATYCEQAAADERKAAQENREIADLHHKTAVELGTTAPH